jgi:hypothetical protein
VAGAAVPKAPAPELEPAERARCASDHTRTPASGADRAVVAAGWTLIGPSQTYNATTVFLAAADWDGMCRPTWVQGFVVANDAFAGTLTPTLAYARSDGALSDVRLWSANEFSAEFVRYTDADPLCCPSRKSTVNYAVARGEKSPVVVPQSVTTERP